ncbi:MAG: TRZ/ATZ family hydrolase [Pseudomonadales bacterium]|nr:TRZ/ATZ family hydrolase [Pseudomonadales bacterium]
MNIPVSEQQDVNQPRKVESIISASWVITMNTNAIVRANNQPPVLQNHSVVFDNGVIVDILPASEVQSRYISNEHFQLDDHVLMPGLINMHGHAAMNLFKGMADDLPLMTWLNEHIWPAEAKWVNDEFVKDGTLLAIAEMIRTGTTFFSDMYFFPETAAEVAREHRIRAQVCFPILDFPTNWGAGPEEYLHKGLSLYDQYKQSEWVYVGFGPHAPYTVSDEPMTEIIKLSNQLGGNVQIHLHETAFEVHDAVEKTGKRPIQRLADLGLLSPNLQCVHMANLDQSDIDLIADSGAHIVHCPESNLKLASGLCPVQKLLDSGVNVALGTDGAASNNNLDMFGELQSAALIAKVAAENAAAVNAQQALAMATINGAKALGLQDQTGSLEVGKWADMIAVDLSAVYHQPVFDVISHLVYSTNGSDVAYSWIGGELHLKEKQLQKIDTVHLKSRVKEWAGKIKRP